MLEMLERYKGWLSRTKRAQKVVLTTTRKKKKKNCPFG